MRLAPQVATQAAGPGLLFEATSPRRVFDTRPGGVALGAGETRRVQVAERGAPGQVITVPAIQGGPVRATALVTSLTTVDTRSAGFLQAWGCEGARPATSVLNSPPRATVPNAAILAVLGAGSTCLSMTTRSHLILDVIAWFEV
jgi:hypothetical protein